MEGALGRRAGGILSLAALIEEHPQALKSDLIDRGLRLRDLCAVDDFNWDDLSAIVYRLQGDQESALYRAMNPDWMWGLPEMLLASTADTLRWLQWAKTSDGQKGRNQPRPIPRPGVKDDREHIGDAPVSVAAMNEFLGWEV